MSNCLLIILVIGSWVTSGGFPSKFSKCCFHRCIRSCWLEAFNLALAVLFLLLTSFIVCHAILDCLSSTVSLILSIWFCMYSVCSFRYTLANSFCVFLSFRAFVLVRFFLLHSEAVFTSARFSLTSNVSYGTLYFLLCLVGMNSVAASKWALTKFSSSSFRVGVSVCSCWASYFFLCANVYLSLISLLLSRASHIVWGSLFGCHSFVGLVVFLPWQFGDRWTHPRMRSKLRNLMRYYTISCLLIRSPSVLWYCLGMCRSKVFPPFFESLYWGMLI